MILESQQSDFDSFVIENRRKDIYNPIDTKV